MLSVLTQQFNDAVAARRTASRDKPSSTGMRFAGAELFQALPLAITRAQQRTPAATGR
jgi:hypothetical protein